MRCECGIFSCTSVVPFYSPASAPIDAIIPNSMIDSVTRAIAATRAEVSIAAFALETVANMGACNDATPATIQSITEVLSSRPTAANPKAIAGFSAQPGSRGGDFGPEKLVSWTSLRFCHTKNASAKPGCYYL